jgi:monovalent cation/hydrogen antiporter
MHDLTVVVCVGLAILLAGMTARWSKVPMPLLTVAAGALIGFLPAADSADIPPELLLAVFVPALLYWDSLNTSLREIRRNWLIIASLAVGLVLVTAGVVTVIGLAFGLPWPVALILGAVLSPTDATATETVVRLLPRRFRAVLRAESLINDGTALVLYGVAVGSAVGTAPLNLPQVAGEFLMSYAVAILVGLVVGAAAYGARLLIRGDRLLNSSVSLITPLVAFLLAQTLHVSGVVAVVTAGLLLSQVGPHIITASMRAQSYGFWQLATFLLNGSLFLVIGFHLTASFTAGSAAVWRGAVEGVCCFVAAAVLRLLWTSATPFSLPGVGGRRARASRERVPLRQRGPLSWAGYRGAVSLAAVLAVPQAALSGDVRSELIAATLAVILLGLAVQGSTMPAVIRFARYPTNTTERHETRLAQRATLNAALRELPSVAAQQHAGERAQQVVRARLTDLRNAVGARPQIPAGSAPIDQERSLELALIPAQRAALFDLRRRGHIDDDVLRLVQAQLDANELRLQDPGV